MTQPMNNEVEQLKSQIKGLQANLQAHQGMLNEALAASVNVRTQAILFQNAFQEAKAEAEKAKAENEPLLKRITELDAQVAALSPQQAAA